ncbi:MAG: hypothetical protein DMG12_18675 [Acidobacteria bacterium]|nr:MAG: hypothetical protein DMG12_18675 [Acidobacteriota bacterium]
MRGLAVVLMLQGHVLDGWVRPQERTGEWFWLSQFLGGFPAPIFLFLVGISLAMVLDRKRARGASTAELARNVVRRGGGILLLAYAFRLEQFLVWYPASDWGDVFRVDTLNCIAVSTVFIGLLSIAFKTRRGNVTAMGLATAAFVFVTPWVYPLRANLPAFLLSYLNGKGRILQRSGGCRRWRLRGRSGNESFSNFRVWLLRLLPHESSVLSRSSWMGFVDPVWRLQMVNAAGRRWLESACHAGASILARILGPHRNRLRPLFARFRSSTNALGCCEAFAVAFSIDDWSRRCS